MAQLKDLIVTGPARFAGAVYGNLTGNAATATTATKATQDSAGQKISTTYIKALSVSGRTITYTKGDGSTGTITTQDTDTNTHYTTHLYAGTSSGAANAATTNGNTYLILTDDSTVRNRIKIAGSGATTVTSDANGNITISSTDTNTNTTYSAGTGLSLSGTTFNHKNSVTAATAQGDASKTLTFGGTFTIPTVTYDAQGHITAKGTTTMTMPANPNTDTHYTTHLYAGTSSGVANAATTNGNTHLIVADNSTARNRVKIAGSGATSVTSDASGNITISSSDTNTWRGIQNNLTSDSTTDSLSAAQGKVLKGLVDGKAASSHTHSYLPLSGGTMTSEAQVIRAGYSTSWIGGRGRALLRMSTISGYSPAISIKTTNGSWEIGAYNSSGFEDRLLFSYCTDTNFNAGNNATTAQIQFNSDGSISGTIPWSSVTGKPSTFTPASHTHNSVNDVSSGSATTFAYSKAGLNYADYTWLAGWNGYELRAVNKSQFATAGHSHSVATTSAAGLMSAADKTKLDHYPYAHAATTSGGISGYLKVKINSTAYWMMSFTIRIYQGYSATDILISGYNYSTAGTWYDPRATIITSNGVDNINVVFGHDATNALWVAVPAGNYYGITILDVNNGYNQISDYSGLFTITNVSSLSGTTDATLTAYRPWRKDETVTKALQDGAGQQINTTYIKALSVSGRTITYTKGNGDTGTITTQDSNTTYPIYHKNITTGYKTAYRTQTKGSSASGDYISTIRCDDASVENAPRYGSGLAWGRGDTQGYLYVNYGGAEAYIGGGNGDKLNWVKSLSFSDHTHNYAGSSSAGGDATNALKLGGLSASTSATKSTIVARDSNNYVFFNYINSNTSNSENPTISQIIVTNGSDSYYRKASLAHLKSSLGSMPASDVYAWAKASTKPTYTASEVGAAAASHTHSGYAASSHSHNYAGSSSAGGPATYAKAIASSEVTTAATDGYAHIPFIGATASDATYGDYASLSESKSLTLNLSSSTSSGSYGKATLRIGEYVGGGITREGSIALAYPSGAITTISTVSGSSINPYFKYGGAIHTSGGNSQQSGATTDYTTYKFRNIGFGTTSTPTSDSNYGGAGSIYFMYS